MTIGDVVKVLPIKVVTGEGIDKQINGGYTSDLLSNVMGFAAPGNIWVTMQGHQNIIAVASLANLAAVVITGGVEPERDTIQKAESEGIVLLTTDLPSFELVGRLYKLGIGA